MHSAVPEDGAGFDPSSSRVRFATHLDDDDADQFQSKDIAMFAGALAGINEHVLVYPFDFVRTRLQAKHLSGRPKYLGVHHAVRTILRDEGWRVFFRGLPVAVVGAGPSHALHFLTYELVRERLGANRPGSHHPFLHAATGACATVAHDLVSTPFDVIRQRFQEHGSELKARSVPGAFSHVFRKEGFSPFFRSLPITVLMNIPHMAAHFTVYGLVRDAFRLNEEKRLMNLGVEITERQPLSHKQDMMAGACAGAVGGLASNPFDVIKTRLQLERFEKAKGGGFRPSQVASFIRDIVRSEGPGVFLKGASARVLVTTPSAAICWTTYEGIKKLVGVKDHLEPSSSGPAH